MDAFELAERFRDFVAREWPGHDQDPGDLFSYFEDWADEADGDLMGLSGGNYTTALQTWIFVQARFAQHPEDFAAIRDFVTVPLDLPPGETHLPGILDPAEWQRRLSARLSR